MSFVSRKKIRPLSFVLCILLSLTLFLTSSNASAETIDLQAAVVTGETAIDFGRLQSLESSGEPVSDSEVRQVRLAVSSDAVQPYVISQMLQDDPSNPNGTVLEPQAIRFSVALEQGQGVVRTGNLEPLRPGMQEIYISSDNEGQTVLLITYDFIVPPGQKAGRYQGQVTYRADVR